MEIDWEECLARLRFGKIQAIAKERFGTPVSLFLSPLAYGAILKNTTNRAKK